ncbi:MAG: hypothetical protein FJ034_05100 [Chloroflexi bacterium]|nr:hypothetical protein [Chloroflexota bacterium]
MRRRLAWLLAAALVLSSCDENMEATGDFVFGVLNATGGRIDANDPAKTLQNTLSGETIGNTKGDPVLNTTRNIAAQTALDDTDSYAFALRGKKPSIADVDEGIKKYDAAVFITPGDDQHAQQRAAAHAARASFFMTSGDVRRESGGAGDASVEYQQAGRDFEEAGRRDLRDPQRGNNLAQASHAFYTGGDKAKACALAREAIASRTDQAHGALAVRVQQLSCG